LKKKFPCSSSCLVNDWFFKYNTCTVWQLIQMNVEQSFLRAILVGLDECRSRCSSNDLPVLVGPWRTRVLILGKAME
jgi:hypothetical protein